MFAVRREVWLTTPVDAFWAMLSGYPGDGVQFAGRFEQPAAPALHRDPVPALPGPLEGALRASGVRLYSHQAEVLRLAREGRDVVLATPTASGKTLAFCLPVFEALYRDPGATALFLYPMKALAYDQIAAVRALDEAAGLGLGVAVYDGDTPDASRRQIRETSRLVLSNPHAMHRYLRYHHLWARFFRGLRFVVLDEAHWYRGVFGTHVAYLLRRLLRVAERYGSRPQVLAASATMADPAAHAARLAGRVFEVVSESGAPRGRREYLFWDAAAWEGRSPYRQAADILALCVRAGTQAMCFSGSRKMAELVATWAGGEEAGVVAYRAGYRPRERREIERGLKEGKIRAVSATNALELGVDIGGMDAVVVAGFPSTVASFRQQAGRAGRSGRDSLVVYVARPDPLDRYYLRHPEVLFGRPAEQAVVALDNQRVLERQVLCASDEFPVEEDRDRKWFGAGLGPALSALAAAGEVRRAGAGWSCALRVPPSQSVALDAFGDGEVAVRCRGQVIERVETRRAALELYPGAVYLHRGRPYRVAGYDPESGAVELAEAPADGRHTSAFRVKDVSAQDVFAERAWGGGWVRAGWGRVAVRECVCGYALMRYDRVEERVELEGLPAVSFTTAGMWLSLPAAWQGLWPPGTLRGGLHALEHALLAAAPVLAMCDRWDVGGPAVFVYDAFPGGSGVSERLWASLPWLVETALEVVSSCRCVSGCPSCVVSPKCGSGNQPLDKAAARAMLEALSRALQRP